MNQARYLVRMASLPTEPFRVSGGIQKIRFRADTGFTVLLAQIRHDEGEDNDATLIGVMPEVDVGDRFSADVTLEEHREYGHQYRVRSMFLEATPSDLTESGVAAYLEARVGGVGKMLAARIAKTFGAATFDILEQEPDKLLQVPGVTKSTLHKMEQSWSQQGLERRLLAGLQSLGLSITQAQRAVKHFGEVALERLEADLFALTEVEGIGFLTADKLWLAKGGSRDDPRRLIAAAVYALQHAAQQGGHSYLPQERAVKGVIYYTRVSHEEAAQAVESAQELQRLKSEQVAVTGLWQEQYSGSQAEQLTERRLYLPKIYYNEKKLAEQIRILLATPPKAQEWTVHPRHLRGLSQEQAQVLELLANQRLVILTGGPGTGKSTTTRAVVRAAQDLGLAVALCAPTGKAARRLSEVTGEDASTIHRLLGFGPTGFKYNHLDPAPFDLFIVDEVSMMGDQLLLTLLSGIPAGSRVLLVGDTDQLPPIDSGLPLQALATAAPTVRLSQVYRQAAQSPIIAAAHALQAGQVPLWGHPQLSLIEVSAESGAARIAQLVQQMGGPQQVQVLTPMRKGPLGVDMLNQQLQALFNPLPEEAAHKVKIDSAEACAGDSVVQTKNDYNNDVFNGTQGLVLKAGAGKMTVDFEGNIVELSGQELFHVQLGYALTVHRAQGSEWPSVLMALHEAHMPMLSRNLAYTALTRARERLVAVGSHSAWATAATRQREERYTALLERIQS